MARAAEHARDLFLLRPSDPEIGRLRARALSNLANVELERGHYEAARELGSEAALAFERLVGEGQEEVSELAVLARMVLAMADTRLGRYPNLEQLEASVSEYAPRSDQHAIVLAITAAVALGATHADPTLSNEQRATLEGLYTERALHWLERALELGYTSAARLAATREFDVLRGHPRFRSLAARLR